MKREEREALTPADLDQLCTAYTAGGKDAPCTHDVVVQARAVLQEHIPDMREIVGCVRLFSRLVSGTGLFFILSSSSLFTISVTCNVSDRRCAGCRVAEIGDSHRTPRCAQRDARGRRPLVHGPAPPCIHPFAACPFSCIQARPHTSFTVMKKQQTKTGKWSPRTAPSAAN